jgi:glyoxylase-like metal-dependent hydrolase (beta-lactamase superfamily II)
MKVTENVYMLDSSNGSHVYAILGNEVVLVDTCMPARGTAILNELKGLGVQPEQIKHILLTHHDVDHIGNAAKLQQATHATVWASAEDIPFIYGQKSRPGIKKYLSMFLKAVPPVDIQPYPQDGNIGEIKVISTPGHTPGHVSLLYHDILFAGDLVAVNNGQIKPSPAVMTWNMPLLLQSMEKVRVYPFRWVCPAHGMPVERGSML